MQFLWLSWLSNVTGLQTRPGTREKLKDWEKMCYEVEYRQMCPNLIGGGVWADVQLAGSGARIVHSAQHLLSAHQHLDLLPWWHTLPTLGLLQSLADEWRIVIHLRLRTLALDPARKSESETRGYIPCVCVLVWAHLEWLDICQQNENVEYLKGRTC